MWHYEKYAVKICPLTNQLSYISWYQHVVTSFIECQQQALDRISELEVDKQQAMSRVTHLEEEIMSHKAHIATLKNELAAACRRPMSDDGLSDHGHYIPGAVSCLCCLSFPVFTLKRTRSTLELSA